MGFIINSTNIEEMKYISSLTNYTVGSRKRAHGRCTLHWAQTGGWADIRVASLLHFNAKERPVRSIVQVQEAGLKVPCIFTSLPSLARYPRPCMWTLEAAHPRTFQYLANCNIYIVTSCHIFLTSELFTLVLHLPRETRSGWALIRVKFRP